MMPACFKTLARALLVLLPAALTAACSDGSETLLEPISGGPAAAATAPSATPTASPGAEPDNNPDAEGDACRARADALLKEPSLPGAPAFDANRIEILGRAKGEPVIFVREPKAPAESELPANLAASLRDFEKGKPGSRVGTIYLRHRRDPRALRALLLREGYAYFSDPHDALALITSASLTDLFDEPEIWILRGSDARRLSRETRRREVTYRYVDGPQKGRVADLLFGDRVAVTEAELRSPLHRDIRALADDLGFNRARILHRTEGALLAELRFGSRWARAVLSADGAKLSLACIAENKKVRDEVEAIREAGATRRRAFARMHEIVTDQVAAGLRFDRPEGEKTAERDGELRPVWATAYFQGREAFSFEDVSFSVFDPQGNPWPPQVCVDFILDTFERCSGTWYSPRGEKPLRTRGALDFNDEGIVNRRAVMAFGKFAEEKPELFEYRRFQGEERIPFGERSKFFQFLVDNADEVVMGDVVAIHGLKRDDRIHQHAILVEWTDPLTGFPYGLADQMKRPRRRTWEGIMAEAPKRSLYYRVRPTMELIEKMAQ